MKKYYVINESGSIAVRRAGFNTTRGLNGTFRCTLVKITTDLSKKRGFTKRERAEAVALKATEYCGETFHVVSNKKPDYVSNTKFG